jgi:hypothetical protein
MNLYQQSHSRIAKSHGPTKESTPEQLELGRRRARAERRQHANKIRGYLSANADLDEWEQMIDELGE